MKSFIARLFTVLRRFVIFFLIILSPLWISALWWQWSPNLPLKVALIDYTVPFDTYAEHNGSMWSFNHLKLNLPPELNTRSEVSVERSAQPRPRKWDKQRSYVGPEPFDPKRRRRLHELYPPERAQRSPLAYDMIYVADTYGVYREDFTATIERDGQQITVTPDSDPKLLRELYESRELDVHMDFSKVLFGGLSAEDLDTLEGHAKQGGDIFFEFNAFCDPTSEQERARAERLAGTLWTGWSGRYLPDPTDPLDAPHWLKRLYEAQYPGRKLPKIPSLLLAHRDGRVFLIESDDPVDVVPTLHVLPSAHKRLKISNTPYYYFWFAIMRPNQPETRVLAEIELHGPPDQLSTYELLDIPTRIPLLTEYQQGPSYRYHLSIDGSDLRQDLGSYHYAGLSLLQSLSAKNRGVSVNQRQVFWQFFLPMLRTILWERSQGRYDQFPPSAFGRLKEIVTELW